jgi:hypothetical protein
MKKILPQILTVALAATAARAQVTYLTIGPSSAENCWQSYDAARAWPPVMTNTFTLPGVTGSGQLISSVIGVIYLDGASNRTERALYSYNVDVSQMSASANHTITLQVPFGADVTCAYDVLLANASGSLPVSVASRATPADANILLSFSGGLTLGSTATPFSMVCPQLQIATNNITVYDEYTLQNTNYQSSASVAALMPRIPILFPLPGTCPNCVQIPMPEWTFQGVLRSNCPICLNPQPLPPGRWEFKFTLLDAESSGFPVGNTVSNTLDVGSSGEFTACLPQQPAFLATNPGWLDIAVRGAGSTDAFTHVGSPMRLKAVPQAFYAASAGTVTALNPGQAVTSVNGKTDDISFRAGANMFLIQSNNTLTFSAGASDRNLKTDFAPVNAAEILARLAGLPIQSWRYTNELAGIRHVGPMAQDFKAAFKLGDDERYVGLLDEGGVALAAIQELNKRIEALSTDLKSRETQNAELKSEIFELRQLLEKSPGATDESTQP